MNYIPATILFCLLLIPALKSQPLTIYGGLEALDSAINSPYFEENPVLDPSGTRLYFTRVKHPGNTGGRADRADIWVAEKNASGWSAPANLGPAVNNSGWNALLGLAAEGNELYVSVEYKDNTNLVRKGVALSRRSGEGWSQPQLMEIPFFTNRSDHQSGWVTADGQVMILSLESPAGYGAEDLYVCFREGENRWTSPRNLGFQINTPFQEMTPFLAEDKKTLIFASNGLGGQGSRDLFISERLDDSWRSWTEPVNLAGANTPGTELSFSFRPGDEFAYLVSTQNSEGYGDIKTVRIKVDIVAEQLDSIPSTPSARTAEASPQETVIEEPVTTVELSGVVRDAKSLAGIAAGLLITDGENVQERVQTEASGRFSLLLPARQSYTITASAKGYMEEQRVVDTFGEEVVSQGIALQPLTEGTTITLSHVLFEQSSAEMIKGSEAELDRVVHMMNENPEIEIYITGHTDNQGPAKANIELSEQRVQSVIKYLTAKGIDPARLSGKGFGPTRPIASNASEETRKLNRRVEFTIMRR